MIPAATKPRIDSWSVMLAGLPRKENARVPNIHFCCCSNVVSAIDMCDIIAPELVQLEQEGIDAFDALTNQNVLVVSPLMCIIGDNPRLSEVLNHLGGSARRYCRMCMVYVVVFFVVINFTAHYIQVDREVNPTQLGIHRTLSSSLVQIQEIQSASCEREKVRLRILYGIRETPNPMLSLPFDPY